MNGDPVSVSVSTPNQSSSGLTDFDLMLQMEIKLIYRGQKYPRFLSQLSSDRKIIRYKSY